MMSRRKITTLAWACVCERCGHEWKSVGDEPPRACSECKSVYWNIPRGVLKRGRKPTKK